MANKISEFKNYTVQHELSCEHKKLSVITNVDNFIGGDNLYIINYSDKMVSGGDLQKNEIKNTQAIVKKEELETILSDLSKYSFDPNIGNGGNLPRSAQKNFPVLLVKREFLDFYKKYGMHRSEHVLPEREKKSIQNFTVNNLFEVINEPNFNESFVFIQIKESKQRFEYIETSEGVKILPPVYLSYIDGTIDNNEYHLEPLAEHLLNNFDIDFIKDDRQSDIVNSKTYKDDKELSGIIKSIPYYNQDDGRTECMEMYYYPSEKETDKILSSDIELKGIYWDRKQFLVKSILGGKSFLVSPPPEDNDESKKSNRNKFRS